MDYDYQVAFQKFLEACQGGKVTEVEEWLSKVDPSDYNNCAIRGASEDGHEEIVRLLLADNRVDPTDQSNYAIRWACRNGHIRVVRLLLTDPRVDPSDAGNWAIIWACRNGHAGIVSLLMKNECVNPKGNWIYKKFYNEDIDYAEIVMFEDLKVFCYVENGDVDSIEDETIRERFIQWQYRIGGEKWTKARDCLID